MSNSLYNTDFVSWIDKTAELLKQGKFTELDIENLIEEVEDLGKNEKYTLRINLRALLVYLLRWQYQPSKRSGFWKGTIIEHRFQIEETLEDSPSLKNFVAQILDKTYQRARRRAASETELSMRSFPVKCPYTVEQLSDTEFLPATGFGFIQR